MAKKRAYLPETPGELTPEWLAKTLHRPIDQIDVTALGEGIGFMGDVLLMSFTPRDHPPASAVVKLPKKANRVMGEMLGVYEREIMFFREFGDEVPIRIPEVYFSEFDRDKGSENQRQILAQIDKAPVFLSKLINFLGAAIAGAKKRRYLLIIEYLDGMQAGDQLAGLGATPCAQVLTEIAKLHRHYLHSPSLDEQFWLLPVDIDARLRHGIFLRHVDKFAASAPPGLEDKLAWLRTYGEELTRRFAADAPATLLHGDLRLDNVVFDAERCAFIDWQLVRCGPAAYDVAYFISSALHEDTDAEKTNELLKRYIDVYDAEDYSFERFKRDYYRALMIILANLAGVEQVELGDGRGQTVMAVWFARLAARLKDVELDELLAPS